MSTAHKSEGSAMYSLTKKAMCGLALSMFVTGTAVAAEKTSSLSEDQVKEKIISESISRYPGSCACPYNSARNGSRCGGRSAWSRAGGYSPICYKREVTRQMINTWRTTHHANSR